MKGRDSKFQSYLYQLKKAYEPIIVKINSAKDRDNYLRKLDDDYTRFILKKLSEKTDKNQSIEIHHIIPLACGGPDEDWNRMELSYSDHTQAHAIRWGTYKEENDSRSLNFRSNISETDRKEYLARSLETRRKQKVGIHNPTVQSDLGKRGGAKQTQAKREAMESKLSPEFVAARNAGMIWFHKSGVKCIMEPHSILLPQDMYSLLNAAYSFPEDANKKSIPGGLLKVIKQIRKTHYGWSVTIYQQ